MKIYLVVTTHEDDIAEVEVFNTPKEATDFIRATIGDIVIDFQRDNCLEELLDYLAEIKVSSDENGDIYYATFGPEGFKTWIEVVEKEVSTIWYKPNNGIILSEEEELKILEKYLDKECL